MQEKPESSPVIVKAPWYVLLPYLLAGPVVVVAGWFMFTDSAWGFRVMPITVAAVAWPAATAWYWLERIEVGDNLIVHRDCWGLRTRKIRLDKVKAIHKNSTRGFPFAELYLEDIHGVRLGLNVWFDDTVYKALRPFVDRPDVKVNAAARKKILGPSSSPPPPLSD